MPTTVIVGGQYGSEGKGKIASYLSEKLSKPYLVRPGGPNAGHTHKVNGKDLIFRQLPGTSNKGAKLFIPAGAIIDPEVLLRELTFVENPVFIDGRAGIVLPEDKLGELNLTQSIGSTGSGNGHAIIRRIKREATAESYLPLIGIKTCTVAPLLQAYSREGGSVLIEGTQGFGLSILHGTYPYCTSRDTTAAEFLSQSGLACSDCTEIILVVRTFPIRVGGNSGPLKDEVSWEEVAKISGAPKVEKEYTSVTKKLRRVGIYDPELVNFAVKVNRPTQIALMGVDRLNYLDRGLRQYESLSITTKNFIAKLEQDTQTTVSYIGTGPTSDDLIIRSTD